MLFASGDATLIWVFIVFIALVGGFCKIWMIIYRPELVRARLENERLKREQRNKVMSPLLGLGAKGVGWWLFRR